jgi:hypothetical protein
MLIEYMTEVKNMRTKVGVFFGILSLLFFLSYLVLFVCTPEMVNSLTAEDHLYENTQAVCFLLASIIFFILFFKDESGNDFHIIQTRKNVFFLLLALLFFFGFGEEISWGQRLFNWGTPAPLAQINLQGETNIHNITIFYFADAQGHRKSFWALMLNFDQLFSIFCFTFCFLIPILDKSILRFSKWVRRLNLPLVPIWMGVLFPLNNLTHIIIKLYFRNSLWRYQSEVKEVVFAILFAALSIWFLTEIQKNRASGLNRTSNSSS